ncbi:subtilisin-like protease [Trichoderma arundinaceum]|uniref:Subtilisin-like protease n=1 Tax=Trichoderma arundinaceum TaxID=490622 RepID=A0A395NCI2_TRIAR|nr:subtilisin-like protease [Trichoderma arundinaceum]
MLFLRLLLFPLATTLAVGLSKTNGGALIIELDEKVTTLNTFAQSARAINYTVRHTFNTTGVFTGISINVSDDRDLDEIKLHLRGIPGIIGIADIVQYEIPPIKRNSNVPQHNFSAIARRGDISYDLGFTLRMGGIDKVHAMGIKGKGVNIGFIDTGIYYKHPALGGGMGNERKIAGGYSFISDNGDLVESNDPYSDCPQSDHATHVAGILGMDPLQFPEGFPISGVAPEASLYAYRIFSCGAIGGPRRGGTSDLVLKAMLKAFEDGVDIISMSLSLAEGMTGALPKYDPLAIAAQQIKDAGVAIVVAMGNGASDSLYGNNLYLQTLPSELTSVISVGAVANSNYPLVYTARDEFGAEIHYSSLYPISTTDGLDVYVITGDSCGSVDWEEVVDDIQATGNLSTTIMALRISEFCPLSQIVCCGDTIPPYLFGFYNNSTNPYHQDYESILPYRFNNGTTKAHIVTEPDADTFYTNYNKSGGYGKYKLFFNNSIYVNPQQNIGGMVDSYSNWGPLRRTFELKPQIVAPGGHILSTFPESIGSYGVISGTSMATPYIAGCFALIKSQFPYLSVDEILISLQATAKPTAWAWNPSMLSTTAQQGAGLVNVYDAITSVTRVSPGQLAVTDNNRTSFGLVNITVENHGNTTQRYGLSHRGAGYVYENVGYREVSQLPNFGSAEFSTLNFELGPGSTTEITVRLSPPDLAVDIGRLPLFSGYIDIIPETGANLSIPYIGPAYSPYNMDYILYIDATETYPGTPWLSFPDDNGSNYNDGFSAVQLSRKYAFSLNVQQWSTLLRVDIVPANTSLTAHFNAANFTLPVDYKYLPSANQLGSTLFGYPSYGNLWKAEGLRQPASNVYLQGTGLTVTDNDGINITLSSGDYRWIFSVLRWGGNATLFEDYDTWLGPIVRLLN